MPAQYLDESYTPSAVVICVVIYNAAFGYSWGPIPWLFPPEIMPQPYALPVVHARAQNPA